MTAASIAIETQLSDADVERVARRTAELLAEHLEPIKPMTRDDVCTLYDISPKTLDKWERDSVLVPWRHDGVIRYDSRQVRALLNSSAS